MKTIPVLLLSAVSCLSLPHLSQGQALPFQKSPPPGTPMPVTPPPPISSTGTAVTSTPTSTTTTIPDGLIMRDGNMYMVKNGELSPATPEQVRDIGPDGIPAGQMMTTDGRLVPLDNALLSAIEERARVEATSNVSGENRSGLAPAGSSSPSATGISGSAQPAGGDAFSKVPPTGRMGNSSTSRGSGSNTVFDQFGNPVVIGQPAAVPPNQGLQNPGDRIIPPPTPYNQNNQATPNQQQSSSQQSTSETTGPDRTTNSTATPNQQFSTGTSINPDATGASRAATPNQLNSRGTNTGPNARTAPPRPTTPNQLNSSGTNTTTNPNATSTGTSGTRSSGTGTSSTSGGSTSSGSTGTSGSTSSGSSGGSSSGSSGSGAAPR